MAVIVGILTALPAFLKALPDIMRVTLKVMQVFLNLANSKWFRECEGSIDKLLSADTSEKKREAARSMVDTISKLG
jgi:hypothetical protein